MSQETHARELTTRTTPTGGDVGAGGTAPIGQTAGMAATASAVAARTLRKFLRSPDVVVSTIVGGATFMMLFRYIFGGALDFGSVAYVDYLIPGMILTSCLIAGHGTAVAVAQDRDEGFSDRLRSLPAPRTGLLVGRAIGDTGVYAFATAVTATIGFMIGFRLHGTISEALLALALCVACGFAFAWVFMCIGLASGNAQAAQGFGMLAYPVIFVSSAYVPVDTMPTWLRPFAEHQPVSVMCNAVRALALGDPGLAGLDHSTGYWVALSLAWDAGIAVVFVGIAVALYRRAK